VPNQVDDNAVRELRTLSLLTCLRVSVVDARNDPEQFGPVRLTDRDMADYVGCLTALHQLDLASHELTDAGIGQLSRLSRLSDLRLRHTQRVTGVGLRTLAAAGVPLKRLRASGIDLGEEGVPAACSLARLSRLRLSGRRDADCMFAGEQQPPLRRPGPRLFPADMTAPASQCTALRCLELGRCALSDVGLEDCLAMLPAVRELTLQKCDQLSGLGLAGLRACPAIVQLNLYSCGGLTVPGLAAAAAAAAAAGACYSAQGTGGRRLRLHGTSRLGRLPQHCRSVLTPHVLAM